MKTTPILFNGAMVKAILEGRKTQTRRVVKGESKNTDGEIAKVAYDATGHCNDDPASFGLLTAGDHGYETVRCPYGQPGDRLWVRETWAPDPMIKPAAYKADWPYPVTTPRDGKWRPSIHMPRWASRITLEITGVRVERVQEITEEDAEAEGCQSEFIDHLGNVRSPHGECGEYHMLWDSINAKRGFGWEVNPWVWVVEFKRVQQ